MEKHKFLLLLTALLFGVVSVYAQQTKQITGVVKDTAGETVIGANVSVKGSTRTGTITDLDGSFSLQATDNDVLVISYVGYVTQEVPVQEKRNFSITLKEDAKTLDEVVVIGYGTQRKGDITSSVASVKADDFNKGMAIDAGQLIQGKVAGLTISRTSGSPTGGTQMLLRGRSTINGSNTDPLVIIDGVPGNLNTVAPEDIEAVDVLKDGSAAAIYGTRGTNGVIIITTKQARGAQINRVEYNAYMYTETIAKKIDMLTAEAYRSQIASGFRTADQDLGNDTDWLDLVTRTPFSHVHNLSFTGGTNQTNYLFNVNYRDTEGIMKKSDLTRLNVRGKVNHKMFNDKLKVGLEFISTNTKNTQTNDGSDYNSQVYRMAQIYNPTAPVHDPKGNHKWYENTDIDYYLNPVSLLEETDARKKSQYTQLNANVTYNPISDLTLTALLSYSKYNETRAYAASKEFHEIRQNPDRGAKASIGQTESWNRLMELTAQYKKKIAEHNFSILAGYSFQDNGGLGSWGGTLMFPTDAFGYGNMGLVTGTQNPNMAWVGSNKWKNNLIGFFGRATYAFQDKYLLMAAVRYEGASQLVGTENEWGTFPSVSLGWKLSEESFIKNLNLFDDLKLRVGYGVTGSQPSSSFLGLPTLAYGAANDQVYFNGAWRQTFYPNKNANPGLKWEEKHEFNIGLDFAILNSRISGSIDFYNREIKDLLYSLDVPTPPNIYSSTLSNVGKLRNRGLEVILNFVPVQTKDFTWKSSVNFSTNSDKLVQLSAGTEGATSSNYIYAGGTGEPIQTHTHRLEVGGSIGNFHGFKVVDVDSDGKWTYEDKDGNHVPHDQFTKNDDNKHILGNGLPKYYAGWNNNFAYKNWDLSITMRGAFDYQILNFQRMFYENNSEMRYNRMKSSQDKVFGKAVLHKEMPLDYNSYYVEDGDFWKIDNITLGYSFPMQNARYVKALRLYASCSNALTITGYEGIDPEVNRLGLDPGNDGRDKYPSTRTFTFGASITF